MTRSDTGARLHIARRDIRRDCHVIVIRSRSHTAGRHRQSSKPTSLCPTFVKVDALRCTFRSPDHVLGDRLTGLDELTDEDLAALLDVLDAWSPRIASKPPSPTALADPLHPPCRNKFDDSPTEPVRNGTGR